MIFFLVFSHENFCEKFFYEKNLRRAARGRGDLNDSGLLCLCLVGGDGKPFPARWHLPPVISWHFMTPHEITDPPIKPMRLVSSSVLPLLSCHFVLPCHFPLTSSSVGHLFSLFGAIHTTAQFACFSQFLYHIALFVHSSGLSWTHCCWLLSFENKANKCRKSVYM